MYEYVVICFKILIFVTTDTTQKQTNRTHEAL